MQPLDAGAKHPDRVFGQIGLLDDLAQAGNRGRCRWGTPQLTDLVTQPAHSLFGHLALPGQLLQAA
ncbi:hypothetical protein [Laribacter hongkongensis]|uniref:hypothetical protein n=1 Tax=Laribacter hongkongensis TaxID=168471 RepID=UPI0013747434|nr:hypothetical protein [Laribacter hongkongensis]MCG9060194.1 hypothetical protein [Laribacter hongkongensis]MCG9087303.1 hypothetical protein [Laribacter hongkongensis]MCG9088057.1 hypothetical protein [Laribacter hongkongensis]MCG9111124.1 hypothetical protein [Laribacter hongkongensis]MCG9121499.1 hypothetical protein [Laribacter hongkongensis]